MRLAALDGLAPPNGRPIWMLLAVFAVLALVDHGAGYFLRLPTLFSVMQLFATLGLAALALGVGMMMGEYDLSIAGTYALAGVVAVRTGVDYPLLGLALAVATGMAAGALQGWIIVWLRISAIALTLGGMLVLFGLTYILAGGETIRFANAGATNWLQQSILHGALSLRALVVVVVFAVLAVVFGWTRIGRDILAIGSNRAGARLAGVNTAAFRVGVFALDGGLAALGGALLSYSLAAASAVGLSDILVPATAAAIIGGVSLGGGKGRPFGVACGVLILCLLRSGLSAIGVTPFMLDTITGAVLLAVALSDSWSSHFAAGRLYRLVRQKQREEA